MKIIKVLFTSPDHSGAGVQITPMLGSSDNPSMIAIAQLVPDCISKDQIPVIPIEDLPEVIKQLQSLLPYNKDFMFSDIAKTLYKPNVWQIKGGKGGESFEVGLYDEHQKWWKDSEYPQYLDAEKRWNYLKENIAAGS